MKLLLSIVTTGFLFSQAQAWDAVGHLTTGQIMSERLSPTAKKRVEQILAAYNEKHGTEYTPVIMPCWMDDIRSSTKAFNAWHYIELPYALEAKPDESQENVLWAAKLCRDILEGKSSHKEVDEARALFILAHLVGDMHQPLHAIGRGDAGGNKVRLTNLEDPMAVAMPNLKNLHYFWDTAYRRTFKNGVAGEAYKTPLYSYENPMPGHLAAVPIAREQAAILLKEYPPEQLDLGGDFAQWVDESHVLGYTLAYGQLPGGDDANPVTLTKAYVDQARQCSQERLVEAGCRLAALLNSLYDKP